MALTDNCAQSAQAEQEALHRQRRTPVVCGSVSHWRHSLALRYRLNGRREKLTLDKYWHSR